MPLESFTACLPACCHSLSAVAFCRLFVSQTVNSLSAAIYCAYYSSFLSYRRSALYGSAGGAGGAGRAACSPSVLQACTGAETHSYKERAETVLPCQIGHSAQHNLVFLSAVSPLLHILQYCWHCCRCEPGTLQAIAACVRLATF